MFFEFDVKGGRMVAKVLVTGGYGCIGAETVKWLLLNTDAEIVIASRTVNAERTARVFHGFGLDRLQMISLDISKADQVNDLFSAQTHTARATHCQDKRPTKLCAIGGAFVRG